VLAHHPVFEERFDEALPCAGLLMAQLDPFGRLRHVGQPRELRRHRTAVADRSIRPPVDLAERLATPDQVVQRRDRPGLDAVGGVQLGRGRSRVRLGQQRPFAFLEVAPSCRNRLSSDPLQVAQERPDVLQSRFLLGIAQRGRRVSRALPVIARRSWPALLEGGQEPRVSIPRARVSLTFNRGTF
jgi:hypothetical protein